MDLAVPPTAPREQMELMVRVIVWCLQHHILVQIHSYPTLIFDGVEKRTKFKGELETAKTNSFNQNMRMIFLLLA